jgi:hypothetical protein
MAVQAAARPAGGRVSRRPALHKAASAAAVAALAALPVFSAGPALAYARQEWQLTYLHATKAWTMSQGSGVTVAILDSGCQPITDLRGQLLPGAAYTDDPATNHGNGQDDMSPDSHGTNMAVDVAGNGTNVEGLAPHAKILPVDVGQTNNFLPANIAAGIQYAVSRHVQVINMSFGAPSDWGSAVDSAIAQAEAANIVVVASTGNESASSVDYPAANRGIVAVGAVGQNGVLWPDSNTGAQVALVAPGVNIYADDAYNQQGTSSGTSNSTAFVSAAAALVFSEHPSWTAGQVIRDLITTADPGPGQTAGQHSNQYGYGILDPVKALAASAPAQTSNPLLGPAADSPGAGASHPAARSASGSLSGSGLLIVVAIAALVLVGAGALVVVLVTRRGGPKPPAAPGGRYPQPSPNTSAQQNWYQRPHQQSPYGQPQQHPPAPYGYGGSIQQQRRPQPNPYGQQPPQAPPGSYHGSQRRLPSHDFGDHSAGTNQ